MVIKTVSGKRRQRKEEQMNTLTKIMYCVLTFEWFALLPKGQAVVPAPDGGYPGGNTAEGQAALLSLTTGTNNTAVGWFSLKSVTTGQYNTAIGAGALSVNTGD
jgi:hypothetical protein